MTKVNSENLSIEIQNGSETKRIHAEPQVNEGIAKFLIPKTLLKDSPKTFLLLETGIVSFRYDLPINLQENEAINLEFEFDTTILSLDFSECKEITKKHAGSATGSLTMESDIHGIFRYFSINDKLKASTSTVSLPSGNYRVSVEVSFLEESGSYEIWTYEKRFRVENSNLSKFSINISSNELTNSRKFDSRKMRDKFKE